MTIIGDSRAEGGPGVLPLRHRDFNRQDYPLEQRASVLGLRIRERQTRDMEFGYYEYDDFRDQFDITGCLIWPSSGVRDRDRGTEGVFAGGQPDRDKKFHGGSWAFPAIVESGSSGSVDPLGMGTTGDVTLRPAAKGWGPDVRYSTLGADLPPEIPGRQRKEFAPGTTGVAMCFTNEERQHVAFVPGNRLDLIAVHVNPDPNFGTLVSDLADDSAIDPERTARLQTLMRVIKDPSSPTVPFPENVEELAHHICPTGQGDGHGGLVFDRVSPDPMSPQQFLEITTDDRLGLLSGSQFIPAGSPGGPTPNYAFRKKSRSEQVRRSPGSLDFLRTSSVTRSTDTPLPAAEPTGTAIGMYSVHDGGILDTGSKTDRHSLGSDADGNPINGLHLSTLAPFRANDRKDGPLLFEEGPYPDPSPCPLKMRVHLVWDDNAPTEWHGNPLPGAWRWYSEAVFATFTHTISSIYTPPLVPPTTGGGIVPERPPVLGDVPAIAEAIARAVAAGDNKRGKADRDLDKILGFRGIGGYLGDGKPPAKRGGKNPSKKKPAKKPGGAGGNPKGKGRGRGTGSPRRRGREPMWVSLGIARAIARAANERTKKRTGKKLPTYAESLKLLRLLRLLGFTFPRGMLAKIQSGRNWLANVVPPPGPGPTIRPAQAGKPQPFGGTFLATAMPCMMGWPQRISATEPDLRSATAVGDDHIAARRDTTPMVARWESFGNQGKGLGWRYTENPGTYYPGGTSDGGWVMLAPEISLTNVVDDIYPTTMSQTCLVAGVNSLIAWGMPDVETGQCGDGFTSSFNFVTQVMEFAREDPAAGSIPVWQVQPGGRVDHQTSTTHPFRSEAAAGPFALDPDSDHTLGVDTSVGGAGTRVVTLPPANTGPLIFQVTKTDSGGDVVAVTCGGGDQIDGAGAPFNLSSLADSVTLKSDGSSGWWSF